MGILNKVFVVLLYLRGCHACPLCLGGEHEAIAVSEYDAIMDNELEVIVGYTGKHLTAYVEGLPTIVVGRDLLEVRHNMLEAIEQHRADGALARLDGAYELRFRVDAATFINYYSGIFTKAALSRVTGINERQLWHYAAGMHKPRKRQLLRIQEGVRALARELESVELL